MSLIEIHLISNRPLLNEFIEKWNSVKVDGETIIKVLTTKYEEKEYVLNNGIKIKYIKQKTFPKTGYMNQAWARNELLCYADSEFILFFDDWQAPDSNILIEHLKYLRQGYTVSGKRLECDKNGNNCRKDSRDTCGIRYNQPGFFYTCNASAKLLDIKNVNGFDNYYCGGTGGEDFDIGIRIVRFGSKALYNSNAIAYHYNHDDIPKDPSPNQHVKMCDAHYLSAYKNIPEHKHNGDWNLMISDELELWWEGPIKYYKCKKCGVIGILDSVQVFQHNTKNNITKVSNGLEQVRSVLFK